MAVTGLGDGVLTLVGNNITGLGWGYEISPTWRWFLHQGAVAFGVAFVAYLVVVGAIVSYAPLRFAKVLCFTMVLAHTWGIISWLHLAGFSYFLEPLVYGAIAIITFVGVERGAGQLDNHSNDQQTRECFSSPREEGRSEEERV